MTNANNEQTHDSSTTQTNEAESSGEMFVYRAGDATMRKYAIAPAAEGDNSPGTITGYAVVWNVDSVEMPGGAVHRYSPGSLKPSPNGVRALYEHGRDALLGRTLSGTLTVTEDDYGVKFSLKLPDTQYGRDVAELVKRGDLSECSFGAWPIKDEFDDSVTPPRVTYTEALFEEITITANPAFNGTSAKLENSRGRNRSQADAEVTRVDLLQIELDSIGLFDVPAK